MNSSHRRPLVAYVLVSVAGAVVVAQGLAGLGIPSPLTPFLDLEQQVAAGELFLEEPQSTSPDRSADPDTASGGSILDEGIDVDEESLTIGSGTDAAPVPEPQTPEQAVSAAPQPGKAGSGPVRSNLVGSGSGSGSSDGPELGGPALGAPGAEAPTEEPVAEEDPKPAPHSFTDTDPKAHPYGTAQPPRGQAKGHDKAHDKATASPTPEPAEEPQATPEKDAKDKPAKESKVHQAKPEKEPKGKSGKDKSNKGKSDKANKGKSDKGLAKGQGKVKPGAQGKKHR